MKNRLPLLLCMAVALPLHAQRVSQDGVVTGHLLDEQQQSLPFANVLVYQASDSVLYKGGIIDEQGVYAIEGLKPGAYFVSGSFTGLET